MHLVPVNVEEQAIVQKGMEKPLHVKNAEHHHTDTISKCDGSTEGVIHPGIIETEKGKQMDFPTVRKINFQKFTCPMHPQIITDQPESVLCVVCR
jgi:hypothetical protein